MLTKPKRDRVPLIEPTKSKPAIADDLLNGCAEIAAHLGWSERKTFYCLERGFIPGRKIGGLWTTLKSRLRDHFEEDRAI